MDAFVFFSYYGYRHIQRDCIERTAIFVTKSIAPEYQKDGTVVEAESTGKHSNVLSHQCRVLTRIQLGSKNPSKGEPVAGKGVPAKATSPAACVYPRTLTLYS